jgi:hypothetical protein
MRARVHPACSTEGWKASARRVPADQVAAMLTLYREHYGGFTVRHFHDKLVRRHGFRLGYTWTKLRLQQARLVARAPRRSAHRKKRPRRPLSGMLLHQDGSRHRWLPAVDRMFDLIVTLDDATSAIYSAFLVDEEGTFSTFRGLADVIEAHGLPCALYTDRGSHYFFTAKAGERVARDQPTQVGRALAATVPSGNVTVQFEADQLRRPGLCASCIEETLGLVRRFEPTV